MTKCENCGKVYDVDEPLGKSSFTLCLFGYCSPTNKLTILKYNLITDSHNNIINKETNEITTPAENEVF